MTNGEAKIRRTLHFKFTLAGASDQMIAMMKSAAPLYQMFGDAQMRLLQREALQLFPLQRVVSRAYCA